MATTARVFVDANALVAGTTYPRFPYEVLQHAIKGDYKLVLSPRVIQEATQAVAVIFPGHIQRLEQFLQDAHAELALTPTDDEIEANSHLIRDPKDVHVALAAINAEVDLLVTQDKDFTDRDESTQALHEKLNIMLPGTFLREHMGWTSKALEAIRSRNWEDMA
jgi:predicted nucleic acid-binding protein